MQLYYFVINFTQAAVVNGIFAKLYPIHVFAMILINKWAVANNYLVINIFLRVKYSINPEAIVSILTRQNIFFIPSDIDRSNIGESEIFILFLLHEMPR